MSEHSTDNPQALLQRAYLLMNQGRHADAAGWFQQVLAINPNDAQTLSQLALCWSHDPAKYEQAVLVARQAIALAPDTSYHHSVLAVTLIEVAKPGQDGLIREARDAAAKALELDPESALAHSVHGLALLRLHRYKEAEAAARQALALNTSNNLATQVLAMSLLNQRKDGDLKSLVDWQLQENPESVSAHVSAGFQALRQGQHKTACEHFREALRLDPCSDAAREGLIHSFRARSLIYGLYLRFCHFMMRFGRNGSGGIMLAGYFGYRFAFASLKDNHPGIAYTLAGLWLVFALWTFLARGLGSALMLTDRFVRMAIRPKERWEGACVGGMVLLALLCLGFGLLQGRAALVFAALACFLSAIPVASAFSNDHHIGKWVDLGVAVVGGGSALAFLAIVVLHLPVAEAFLLFEIAAYSGVAISWMRMFRIWVR